MLGVYDKNLVDVDLPTPPSPLFWKAHFKVSHAYYLWYQRTIFHTQNHFSLNLGASIADLNYESEHNYAFSGFLDMRFWLWHNKWFDPYLNYSVAGPTWLSKKVFGTTEFSEHFVFQDALGLGATLGKDHKMDLGFSVVHYSNGDLFPINGGIQVPFVIWLGYSFH